MKGEPEVNEQIAKLNREIGERISARRLQLGMSQDELASKTGYTSASKRTIIQKIEAGKIGIKQSKIDLFAAALEITRNQLMGWEEEEPNLTDDTVTFHVIGDIAAGYDRNAVEEYTGVEMQIPRSWLKGRKQTDFFMLRVKGDSMYPMYQDGDVILVRKQSTLNHSGQIGVVIYGDDKATLKKVEYVYGEDWMKLVPINPNYPPTMVENEALEHCWVLGYPVKLIREI